MIQLFIVCLVLGLRGNDMNKLERLNNGSSAVFKHDDGSRCIVQHTYGTVCTYSVTIYAKSKRVFTTVHSEAMQMKQSSMLTGWG
jgi:hypothetical protein